MPGPLKLNVIGARMIPLSHSSVIVVVVFVATYLGMALGRVPRLHMDRTGIALFAVAVLLATETVTIRDVGDAQDGPTLILLFALMLVSAQFSSSGFYDLCLHRLARADLGPKALLALVVFLAGAMSAVLVNDVVVFAMTPILCRTVSARGLDARPFLIGLAGGSNAGSAATLIGNPQNLLIGQVGGLDFWDFFAVCGPPALAAMGVVFATICLVWRTELSVRGAASVTTEEPAGEPSVDRRQVAKGAVVLGCILISFATPLPHAVGALSFAALLLASRKIASRALLSAVDWQLLLLFACLFTVTAAFSTTGIAQDGLAWLRSEGLFPDNIGVLAPLAVALSNSIGNVPAVILIVTVWPDASQGSLYGLAVLSTLAGNFLLVGSLANLIVAERSKSEGIVLGFRDFARSGIPMTLVSILLAALWLGFGGWMPWSAG